MRTAELVLESLSLVLMTVILALAVANDSYKGMVRLGIVVTDLVIGLGLVAGIAGTIQAWPT